jgi:hypothetical protein
MVYVIIVQNAQPQNIKRRKQLNKFSRGNNFKEKWNISYKKLIIAIWIIKNILSVSHKFKKPNLWGNFLSLYS